MGLRGCRALCAAQQTSCSDSFTPEQTLHDRKQDRCRALNWTNADRQGHSAVRVWCGRVSSHAYVQYLLAG